MQKDARVSVKSKIWNVLRRGETKVTRKQCIFYKKLLDAGMTQSKNDYFPRCQMSRSYSAMVRSEENIPALAMFTRHLRRQPMGSQA